MVSRVRGNREYLISQEIAEDLNTYNYFGLFYSYNDYHKRDFKSGSRTYQAQNKKTYTDENSQEEVFGSENSFGSNNGSPAVRSIFNRSGGMMVGTDTTSENISALTPDIIRKNASGWRISNNVPLLDSPENRKRIRQHSGCSVKELVQQSAEGYLGRAIYSYADFMFCKHLGKVSNNYLITLRRFPTPPGDFISTVGDGVDQKNEGKNRGGQQIGCMVTWLGVSGNDAANIMKYSYKMPYKEKESEWNQVQGGNADSGTGVLNSVAAAFDPAYRRQYVSGHGGAAFNAYIGKFFRTGTNGPYPVEPFYDANKIYGPIDKVKSTMMRSETGLEFDQTISLKFEYELRAYNGINTRQAMLDLLSNILQVTYTTGGFWGGGYRGGGMHQNSIFNNLEIFKCKGGFTDFMDAFSKDYSTVTSKIATEVESNGGILQTIKKMLNALGGMILGGALNKLGRPQRAYANSLLSEQPVGMWHLMIGNPNHPIMSMGNMVITNTTVTHYGPLGIDDFPAYLTVTVELKRGKPRDLREIEKIYMHGNDRIYFSMGKKVADIYKMAAAYKAHQTSYSIASQVPPKQEETPTEDNSNNPKDSKSNTKQAAADAHTKTKKGSGEDSNTAMATTATNAEPDIMEKINNAKDAEEAAQISMNDMKISQIDGDENFIKKTNAQLLKWFGETDMYSISFAAMEQEYGASKKRPTKEKSGSDEKNKTTKTEKTTKAEETKK